MTEEAKLDAGLYYDFWDVGVNGRKLDAIKFCRELRKMQDTDAPDNCVVGGVPAKKIKDIENDVLED